MIIASFNMSAYKSWIAMQLLVDVYGVCCWGNVCSNDTKHSKRIFYAYICAHNYTYSCMLTLSIKIKDVISMKRNINSKLAHFLLFALTWFIQSWFIRGMAPSKARLFQCSALKSQGGIEGRILNMKGL